MRLDGRARGGIGGLAWRTIKGYLEDDMGTYAAALAYNTLFALFPFAIFLGVVPQLGKTDGGAEHAGVSPTTGSCCSQGI